MMNLEAWDSWIREKADYYTVVVFRGRGMFDRRECKSLEQARGIAKQMASTSTRPAGIYAIRDNHQSHIENVYG